MTSSAPVTHIIDRRLTVIVAIIAFAGVVASAATSYIVSDKTASAQSKLATASSVRQIQQNTYVSFFEKVTDFDRTAVFINVPALTGVDGSPTALSKDDAEKISSAAFEMASSSFDVQLVASEKTRDITARLVARVGELGSISLNLIDKTGTYQTEMNKRFSEVYVTNSDSFGKLEEALKESMRVDLGISEK